MIRWGTALTGMALLIVACATASATETRFGGIASFYGLDYSGKTASGELYDPAQFTAAHPSLPFGTVLRVANPKNGRIVYVVVNDRGPFVEGRVLDLSLAAAKRLGMVGRGLVRVAAEVHVARPIPLRSLFSENMPAR